MHQEFRELLKTATGVSEHIIAVLIDIRGFTPFSKKVDSVDTAIYIKKVYEKLIDEYFSHASFFKPLGDGLLITIPYTEENLNEVATDTIEKCFTIMEEFGSICANDPMINFETPQKVGIGLSRGSTCRLISGNKTLDYSGRVLNLTSRLMDLARPSGIVFDANFGITLLPDDLIELFSNDSVYIKGIAEREGEAIDIYHTKDVNIHPSNKHPFDKTKWGRKQDIMTLKQIRDYQSFLFYLDSEPTDPDRIKISITHPHVIRGKKQTDLVYKFDYTDFQYILDAGRPLVKVVFVALIKRLEKNGVRSNWEVQIDILYPKK